MEWLAAQLQAALAGVDEFSRWLVGAADGKASYELTRWVFLRALGVIYLIAFLSLWPQLRGLIGPQGILPAQDLLAAARRQLGGERLHLLPTPTDPAAGGSPAGPSRSGEHTAELPSHPPIRCPAL